MLYTISFLHSKLLKIPIKIITMYLLMVVFDQNLAGIQCSLDHATRGEVAHDNALHDRHQLN